MSPNDLLAQCLAHVTGAPATGAWGAAGAPYQFETLADGRRRLVISNPETGDRVGAVGATNVAAIAAMATKLGIAQEA